MYARLHPGATPSREDDRSRRDRSVLAVHGSDEQQAENSAARERRIKYLQFAFSAARQVTDRVLPEPIATRFRYRSELIQHALAPSTEPMLPLSHRLELARAGFDERLYRAYGFDRGVDPEPYLSEYARKCAKTANSARELLRNKETFHAAFASRGLAEYVPTLFGILDAGTFQDAHAGTSRDLHDLLCTEGRLVIKEVLGGGGAGVYVVEQGADRVRIRGPEEVTGLAALRSQLDRAIVTEFCEQTDTLARIYPSTPNTLRILTLRFDDGEIYVPAAAHRFGADGDRSDR